MRMQNALESTPDAHSGKIKVAECRNWWIVAQISGCLLGWCFSLGFVILVLLLEVSFSVGLPPSAEGQCFLTSIGPSELFSVNVPGCSRKTRVSS